MTGTESTPPFPRNEVLETLRLSFPVFHDGLPLAISIHKVILKRLPDIDPQALRSAMKMHTRSTRYLKCLTNSSQRFDLDGIHTGEVTAEQKQEALKTLRDRFKKRAEHNKEEVLAQQRQGKLSQLAEKFNVR